LRVKIIIIIKILGGGPLGYGGLSVPFYEGFGPTRKKNFFGWRKAEGPTQKTIFPLP
jgi:hypothetical protein